MAFLSGMGMVQRDRIDDEGFSLAAAVALAVIVAVIVFLGHESRALRWIAYFSFAFELVIVYLVMVGSMLGTAGFFFAAVKILARLAYAIICIERRMRHEPAQGASSIMSRYKLVVAAIVLALAKIGFLSWMISCLAAILRDGK